MPDAETADKILAEGNNILGPVSERWDIDHDAADAIVKIISKIAVFDSLRKVLI